MSTFECIFCGSSEGRSREHVLRKKFNKTVPAELISPEVRKIVLNSDGSETRQAMPMSQFDVQVNQVCGPCNNGWLNDLENQVEIFVNRFFSGADWELQIGKLDELALWMYIRALMRTCVEKRDHRAPLVLFREVFESRRVPKRAIIHIAAVQQYSIQAGRYSWGAIITASETSPSAITEENYLGVVTFGLGRLLFQAWIPGLGQSPRLEAVRQRRWLDADLPGVFHLIHPFDLNVTSMRPLAIDEIMRASALFTVSNSLRDPIRATDLWSDGARQPYHDPI